MYQQKRGKNDVNKTESLKHNFPKIFFIQLTIPRTSFSGIESNRTFAIQAWVDINRVLITVFLFFFFNRFDSNRRDFIDTISLFFPPRRSMAERGGKSGGHVLEFPPLPLPIISLTRRGRHVSTHVPCVGARAWNFHFRSFLWLLRFMNGRLWKHSWIVRGCKRVGLIDI